MANLNLSEFTEKLFVADADHTFIWDTAASISKRVSRNSWLNSGTLTSDAPVTISQTWNAGSNVMTAFKVVATDVASGATSNLFELWAGSTPALDFAVTKAGVMEAYGTYSSAGANYARLALACDSSGNATISTQALGTGTAGTVSINGVPVGLGKGNVSSNVAIGNSVLAFNTTGSHNVGLGNNALNANTTGFLNIGIGLDSLKNETTGRSNIAIGVNSLNLLTTANYNTAVGEDALNRNLTSAENSAFGRQAAYLTTGASNTALGARCFLNNTTGARNVATGYEAGSFISGGSTSNSIANDSIFIGANTKAAASGETNQIVIGYDATGIGSRSVVLGNDSIEKTALKGNVGIGTTSPTSKLQVSAGDVEVDTIAKGVILKSPDGTRYRVTVANGGTLSVAAV